MTSTATQPPSAPEQLGPCAPAAASTNTTAPSTGEGETGRKRLLVLNLLKSNSQPNVAIRSGTQAATASPFRALAGRGGWKVSHV